MNKTAQKDPATTNGDGLATVPNKLILNTTGCFGSGDVNNDIIHRESSNGVVDLIVLIIIIVAIAIVVAIVTFFCKKKSKKNKLLKTATLTGIETKFNDIKVKGTQQPSLSERRESEGTSKTINN
uniref:Uncharacterized protein n=1 Tax=Strongyloides papillosus TaxID=174720 RepID=A0A0N5BHD4_STREA